MASMAKSFLAVCLPPVANFATEPRGVALDICPPVGIDFRVKHQEVDVAPRAEHVVQACRAYVVGPTVAPDDPDALAHQRVSDSEKRAGLRRIDARELAFQLGDALALGFDSCFLRLIGFAQTRH